MRYTAGRSIRLVSAVLAMVLMIAMLTGCGKAQSPAAQKPSAAEQQDNGTIPAEPSTGATQPAASDPTQPPAEESQDPTMPPVQVVMPQYELTYSGAMAEVITWEELEEEGGLCFYVELSTGKLPIFTLLLNQVKGDTVFMKENVAGEQIPVSFLMEAVPESLNETDVPTFCMAQDIVNDIMNSLILK